MLKKLLYIVIVIIAFVLGHNYGENTVSVIEDLPIPTITIEMPQAKDELDILEENLAAEEAVAE